MTSTPSTEHYCIQAPRIERIEVKIDAIDGKLDKLSSVDGTVGKIAQQIERLSALIENNGRGAAAGAAMPEWLSKLPWLVALGLVGILGALLGTKLPF